MKYAQAAYTAYLLNNGDPKSPTWDKLTPVVQQAWQAAVKASYTARRADLQSEGIQAAQDVRERLQQRMRPTPKPTMDDGNGKAGAKKKKNLDT